MYDELAKRLREAAIRADSGYEISESLYSDIMQAADAIEERSKPKWIPVTERLPELNANVLVYSAHSGLIRIDANIWFDRNATHWMPLPQPPKEVRNCDT